MNSFLSTQIPCTLHNVNTDFHMPNILFNHTFVKQLKTSYFPPYKPLCSTTDDDGDDDGEENVICTMWLCQCCDNMPIALNRHHSLFPAAGVAYRKCYNKQTTGYLLWFFLSVVFWGHVGTFWNQKRENLLLELSPCYWHPINNRPD